MRAVDLGDALRRLRRRLVQILILGWHRVWLKNAFEHSTDPQTACRQHHPQMADANALHFCVVKLRDGYYRRVVALTGQFPCPVQQSCQNIQKWLSYPRAPCGIDLSIG